MPHREPHAAAGRATIDSLRDSIPLAALVVLFVTGALAGATLGGTGTTVSTTIFQPVDDAHVRADRPSRNYGDRPALEVDGEPAKDILLKFTVSGVGSGTVTDASLRLFAVDPSSSGGDLRRVPDTSWSEGTVTWETAPPPEGPSFASLGEVVAGTWSEVDVPFVDGDGTYAIRVSSTAANGADFSSAEGSASPQLVVTAGGGDDPPTETTPPPTETTPPPTETTPPPPPPPPPPPGDAVTLPARAAFYYPWFPETWTVGGAHVAYHPTLGYYDSSDPAVVDAHVRALEQAKVNVGIASWWGQNTHSEGTRIPLLLDRTAALGSRLRWTLYYEREGSGNPSVAQIRSDLAYIRDRYATHPSYAYVSGRPAIFVYAADDTTCEVADRWAQATAGDWYVSLKVFSGYRDCPNQPPTWHQYSGAQASDRQSGHSFTISPGFWRADEPTPRLARDPQRWRDDVRAMVASNEPWQLVVSFNEWGEGTAVESATEWGTAYIDALATDGAAPPAPPGPTPPPTSAGVVVAVAGDIAKCDSSGVPYPGTRATAALLDALAPERVLTTGDNAYEEGTLAQYQCAYQPTWGRLKARTRPTPGNHEYLTPGASGYFDYFGAAAGDRSRGYYAFDIAPGWRAYALNSNCSQVGGCGAGSPQHAWLQAELAANPRACVLAYWHHPRFASGQYADDARYQPFWQLLYAARAELVLNGHDHNYQRYVPLTPGGSPSADGLREFVVGTGGKNTTALKEPGPPTRAAASTGTFGLLELTLRSGGYDWQFVPEAGKAYTDTGSASCR